MIGLVATLALLIFVGAPSGVQAMGRGPFKEVTCDVIADGQSVGMWFRDSERGRHLVIIRPYHELLIERREELEKGSIDWDRIENIELRREVGKEGGFLVVNVKPEWTWRGSNVVEFGYFTDGCWDEIRNRFGNDLQFVESVED